MRFKQALWDGSDPDYAPGLVRSKGKCYWRASKAALKAGYSASPIRLPGEDGDSNHRRRADLCREYTREMVCWLEGGTDANDGTWRWVIARYLGDDTSPFRSVKANTQANYREWLGKWQVTIGNSKVAACNHAELVRWQNAMKEKDRSPSYIKRMFTMLRIVVNYGVMIEDAECARISLILSKMRIKAPQPRKSAPTREQIEAIVREADAAGQRAFAAGLLIQWWFALRAVDVRGQWLPIREGEPVTGIIRNRHRWADGMTWDMIDRDVTQITKTPSKTEARDPEPMILDLTETPEIRERLLEIGRRAGPVLVNRKGEPFESRTWAHLFRRFARKAGVPDDIWMMDTRAGAITEAKMKGASPYDLRDAAGHRQLSTTDRYARDRSAGSAKVLKLRRS